jgi:hypothetical protein
VAVRGFSVAVVVLLAAASAVFWAPLLMPTL